jgi:hypothetical protein
LKNLSGEKIKAVDWHVHGRALRRSIDNIKNLKITADSNSSDSLKKDFYVEVPEGYSENDFASITATAKVTLNNGKSFTTKGYFSGRIKEAINISGFNLTKTDTSPTITGCVNIKSYLTDTVSGTATLKINSDNVKVDQLEKKFTVEATSASIVKFNLTPKSTLKTKAVDATLVINAANYISKEIPVKIKFSPSIVIPHKIASVKFDGKLNDKVWNDIGFNAKNFAYFSNGKLVDDQTEVGAYYTDKSLFVGIKCYTKDMTNLLEKCEADASGYNAGVLKDDSFEIYLRPLQKNGKTSYIRLGGSSKGVKRKDKFADVTLENAGMSTNDDKNTWSVKTSKHNDRWEAEIEIPFSVIGYTPESGNIWGINFCRNQPRGEGASSWSCTYGEYAKPNFFGWGIFE